MNVLITGGCGFLGQHLTKALLQQFPQIRIKLLDLKESSHPLHQYHDHPQVSYLLNKNICNLQSITRDFQEVDVVFHLAGIVSFWTKDKQKLFSVNVQGTKNVFQAALTNKVKRFIHISSVAALGYNNQPHHPIDETFKFNWNIAKKYKKYYMVSKYLADQFLIQKQSLIYLNIAYPGLMLGPGDGCNSPKLITAIKNNQIPFNPPGGTNVIDVRDVVQGLIAILKKGKPNNHYLLSGSNFTFQEQNKIISQVLEVSPPKRVLPSFFFDFIYPLLLFFENRSKKGPKLTSDNLHSSFQFRYFNNHKAKEQLNWQPQITFDQTIKDINNWMKNELK